MDDLTDQIASTVTNIAVSIVMVVLILWGGLLVVLAWILIKTGIDWLDQQALLREAQAIFDRVRAENLPHLQIDPLIHSIFGEDVDLPGNDATEPDDWLFQAVFGKD